MRVVRSWSSTNRRVSLRGAWLTPRSRSPPVRTLRAAQLPVAIDPSARPGLDQRSAVGHAGRHDLFAVAFFIYYDISYFHLDVASTIAVLLFSVPNV